MVIIIYDRGTLINILKKKCNKWVLEIRLIFFTLYCWDCIFIKETVLYIYIYIYIYIYNVHFPFPFSHLLPFPFLVWFLFSHKYTLIFSLPLFPCPVPPPAFIVFFWFSSQLLQLLFKWLKLSLEFYCSILWLWQYFHLLHETLRNR